MYATTEILAGSAENSIAVLDKFLMNDPSYPQALLVIAEAYFCTGKKEKGLEFAEKLKAMQFNIKETFVQFAGLLVSASRCGYAISLLESAFEPDERTSKIRDLLNECRQKLR
jgi:Tfp pilus assembly protein PilF